MFRLTVAPGLELRQLELADTDAMFAVTERNRAHLREWLPWVDRTRSSADTRAFISSSLEQFEDNKSPSCAIWLDGEIAGALGCHRIDWLNRNCDLGYWIDAAHQGKGVVTRCAAVMVDYLFDNSDLHRVTIRCGTGNHKSCAVPQRLGFMREGVLREAEWVNDRWVDLVVWSMLAHDWRRLHARK
jgi:ribosomal-protein-serine acetyltransferase